METALVKFLLLWIMCENIVLTTSMALKEIANEDANTRQKRSPASLFGFNLGNPVSTARESFSNIGNIFSGNRGNTHHNNHYEPIQPYGQQYERNTNTHPISIPNRSAEFQNSMGQEDFQKGDRYVWPQENNNERFTSSPISIPNRSGIPNSKTQDNFQQGDKYILPQENKNEGFKKQKPYSKLVPVRNNEAPQNTGDNPGNGDINKHLHDYMFQKPEFNHDGAGSTVDNNIDFVTETGEYETTTGLDQRILPPAAVATLLG